MLLIIASSRSISPFGKIEEDKMTEDKQQKPEAAEETKPEEKKEAKTEAVEETKPEEKEEEKPEVAEEASSVAEPVTEPVVEQAAEPVVEKGPSNQPKSTKTTRPTECASTGKTLLKKIWYFRNGEYFANKKAYKRKVEEAKKKAEEEAAKA